MLETHQLREALARWREGEPAPLLRALGFERVGLRVPRTALAEFGLDPSGRIALEVAARHAGFNVFRITFGGALDPEDIRRTAAALYRHNPTRRALLVFDAPNDARLVLASWGLGPGPFRLAKLWIDPAAPRRSELDILANLAVNGAATASELAIAHAHALDREIVTRKFFAEFRRHRAQLAAAITGLPETAAQDRLDLALILLGRLLFLYFIQRKGWLAGDPAYLRNLYEAACRERVPFYRRRLEPLFFGALDRPPGRRGRLAAELGDLPYLNGGLFERDPVERSHRRLDVPNASFATIFQDLLDKYQFTLREDQPADQDVAVDPEMLGKVFEGLMASPERGSTGAFFTPRTLVDRLVDGALTARLAGDADAPPQLIEALLDGERPEIDPRLRERLAARVRSVRVLDPAVGSGAFLLAALQRLERLRDGLDGRPADAHELFARRREIIRGSLYGVDVNGAAVRLCELRLWLALVVDLEVDSASRVPPLPNLDINIRQGDALVDPIDFLVTVGGFDDRNLAGRWRKTAKRLADRRARYFHSSGSNKRRSGRALRDAEHELAMSFLAELAAQIDERRRDLQAAATSRDLFGKRAGLGRRQKKTALALQRRMREVRRLLAKIGYAEELPFFSFQIHFADPERPHRGFDVILGNPPWVRTHHWSGLPRRRLKERFEFLREAGWRAGGRLAGAGRGFGAQLDLSALFLERSLDLLGERGVLGFLLPAKLVRSLSAGALRQRLLSATRLIALEDCSSTPARLFEATTYPLAVLLRRGSPNRADEVRVRLHDRREEVHEFSLPQSGLPALPNDAQAPWALASPPVRAALDRMRAAGPPLGSHPDRRPRRGILTGANEVFVGEVVPRAGAKPLDRPRADVVFGADAVQIEAGRLRPVLRGEDLEPWRFTVRRAVIWTHDDRGHVLPSPPPATRRHLRRHERALRSRRDLKPGQPWWTLFRVDPEKWKLRVAWRDIGTEPAAVVIPARVAFLDRSAPIIGLNTVYHISARSQNEAHFLAALLNSTPARAYLKAIAQRAAGGYFRFFASTVALLPFPERCDSELRSACVGISRRSHEAGRSDARDQRALDELMARAYGLRSMDISALRSFDACLTDPPSRSTADPEVDP